MDMETTFIRADLKMRARQAMSGNWGILIPVILIMSSLSIIYSFTPYGSLSESVVAILDLVFHGAFVFAGCTVFLNLTYRIPTSLSDFFAAFADLGKSLPLWGLMVLKVFLWMLLLVIPGIIKGIAYSQAFYIKAENPELSASEVLALSEEMTNGYKMDIFVLYLSFVGWYFLSVITLGVAGLYAAPYFNMTMTQLYLYLKEAHSSVNAPSNDDVAERLAALEAQGSAPVIVRPEDIAANDSGEPAKSSANAESTETPAADETHDADEYSEESSI